MNRELMVKILLWYNVISLGIWAGGTVYHMSVIVPLWSDSPESLRTLVQGTRYMTTVRHFFGPVTQIARGLPLLLLVAAAWNQPALRPWIIACAATFVFGLVLTRAYIYPMNEVLLDRAGEGLSPEGIRAMLGKWILADRVRFAVMSCGYLCLLRAFSMPLRA